MKFLVDAQLPQRLADLLEADGHDVVHTKSLPLGNRTPDGEILRIAGIEARIVVTKDADFVESHLIRGRPEKLLLVATGDISNDRLLDIFSTNRAIIEECIALSHFVEITRSEIIVHD